MVSRLGLEQALVLSFFENGLTINAVDPNCVFLGRPGFGFPLLLLYFAFFFLKLLEQLPFLLVLKRKRLGNPFLLVHKLLKARLLVLDNRLFE